MDLSEVRTADGATLQDCIDAGCEVYILHNESYREPVRPERFTAVIQIRGNAHTKLGPVAFEIAGGHYRPDQVYLREHAAWMAVSQLYSQIAQAAVAKACAVASCEHAN